MQPKYQNFDSKQNNLIQVLRKQRKHELSLEIFSKILKVFRIDFWLEIGFARILALTLYIENDFC